MFREFSFDGASRHPPALAVDYGSDISPTSTPAPAADLADSTVSSAVGLLIRDLQMQFDQQRLEGSGSYWNNAYLEMALPAAPFTFELPQPSLHGSAKDASSPTATQHPLSVRSRRQMNARLQCNPTHVRKISSLVEKMIARSEQCSVRPACLEPGPSEYDSGEDSGVECDPRRPFASTLSRRLKYRRAGDHREGSTCVLKTIRQRRRKDVKLRSDYPREG